MDRLFTEMTLDMAFSIAYLREFFGAVVALYILSVAVCSRVEFKVVNFYIDTFPLFFFSFSSISVLYLIYLQLDFILLSY